MKTVKLRTSAIIAVILIAESCVLANSNLFHKMQAEPEGELKAENFDARASLTLLRNSRDDELSRTISFLARVGIASSPTFSPDGTRVAFVSNLTGLPAVWSMPTAGGFPTLIAAFDDPVGFVTWSPSGAWLAFDVAPGGGLNQQIYIVEPDGTHLTLLTDGKSANFLSGWMGGGKYLAFSSNRRNGVSTDSYLIDVDTRETRLVAESKGAANLSDMSSDGRFVLLTRLLNRGDNNVYLIDLKNSSETLLTAHSGLTTFSDGKFSPDGRTVYLASNKDRDRSAFAEIRIQESGKPGPVVVLATREDAELSAFAINKNGTFAALMWNAADRSDLNLFDLRSNRIRYPLPVPAEIAGGMVFTNDGRRLAMAAIGASKPQDIWIVDLATRRLRQLTQSPHAGVDLSRLVQPELVRYKSFDGLELSGWLYRPHDAKGAGPLVLNFHGGPESQERPGFNGTYQALVEKGISVFAPNVRGSSGFGKRFVNLDNGALRENSVRDIKATVDYLIQERIADPKLIGIMGGSYGGYMVMAGLTQYPELFAAGVDLFGIVNFETFFKNTQPWIAAVSKSEYGDPEKDSEVLKRLSPINHIDRVRVPLLVLHGANDTNVPVIEPEQIVENLKQRGVPVEYILFPDEGHGWRKTSNRIRSAVAIVLFFEKYLHHDASQSKAG